MIQGKARIGVELDTEEALRQLQALQGSIGPGGSGGGTVNVPGSPARPPPRVPVSLPPSAGGGGGFLAPVGGMAGAAALAALAVTLKDAIKDGMAPLKNIAGELSNAVRRGLDDLTGGAVSKMGTEGRALEAAREKTMEFGRETFGRASPETIDAYMRMQYGLLLMKEQGARKAEDVVKAGPWTTLGGIGR
jgi:hypothetical protein